MIEDTCSKYEQRTILVPTGHAKPTPCQLNTPTFGLDMHESEDEAPCFLTAWNHDDYEQKWNWRRSYPGELQQRKCKGFEIFC
jgi:hypothetical protein